MDERERRPYGCGNAAEKGLRRLLMINDMMAHKG
jgi:hypothetical protein